MELVREIDSWRRTRLACILLALIQNLLAHIIPMTQSRPISKAANLIHSILAEGMLITGNPPVLEIILISL